MKPGQTMYTDDGKYQVCLFPMDYMYITQVSSPSSFSHCCGHPCDYVGTTPIYPIYAPCDMELIRVYPPENGNNRIWQSQKEVWTPLGARYVCVMFTHDDNPPYSTVGVKVKQGSLIAHTGTTGFVTGDHSHIDQAFGQGKVLVDYGITCASGNECWALQDSTYPYEVFFNNDTTIVETQGYTFQQYTGGIIPPTPTSGTKMKWIYYLNKRRKDD